MSPQCCYRETKFTKLNSKLKINVIMQTECRYLLENFEYILIVCSELISMQELMYHMLPLNSTRGRSTIT